MARTIIHEDAFPEIVEEYNNKGKTAAYDLLQNRYRIRHPYFVLARIRKCGKYTYDPDTDRFMQVEAGPEERVFMNLDELCGTAVVKAQPLEESITDSRPMAMEKLVHELISDRLLTLNRYITLDSSARRILIDQTSLTADGYQIVTH